MYFTSKGVSKFAALSVTMAVLFLFLADPVLPASDNLWGNVQKQPQMILKGNYQQVQPGLTYNPLHLCWVDHNGPPIFCVSGMPVPMVLYEYQDPSQILGCGPPTYPFQVDTVWVELCNPGDIPCNVVLTPEVYDVVLSNPKCPAPGPLVCHGDTFQIFLAPHMPCTPFPLTVKDTRCVAGPYFAAVNFLASSCVPPTPTTFGPCTDDYCDTCKSYFGPPQAVPQAACPGFPGNWRIGSIGRSFGQNDCKQDTCWYYKKGYLDYAPFGVPDFDQKQDNWKNQLGAWTYCGPTALANSFWWFDSKFDSLSPGPPPTIHDGYPLVKWLGMPPSLDDHDTSNVPLLIQALAACMQTGQQGTNVFVMESCIVNWIEAAGLDHTYYESTLFRPEFDKVEKEVKRSQDVIMLLGFYDMDCRRIGGHYVTMAGVCSSKMQIAISDPFFDHNEGNPPGPPAHGPTVHNDAALISGPHGTNIHDTYQAVPLMPPDPCLANGLWELIDYPDSIQYVYNFEMQNENPFTPNQPYLGGPLRTIVEFAVDVSPESCIAIPGDANASATITLADVISIVNYIFQKPGWPPCPSASVRCWLSDLLCRGDVNGDYQITLADVIYLVNYYFGKPGGPWYPKSTYNCCLRLPGWPPVR